MSEFATIKHVINARALPLAPIACALAFLTWQNLKHWIPGNNQLDDGPSTGHFTALSNQESKFALNASTLASLQTRPLFTPERRQPEQTRLPSNLPNQLPPSEAIARFELIGTLLDSRQLFAVFREKHGQGTKHLKQGDVIGGWSLQTIESDRVTLIADGGEERLLTFSTKR